MKKRIGLVLCLGAGFLAIIVIGCAVVDAAEPQKRPLLRVGVYDSRAIAIAYAPSSYNEAEIQALMAEQKKAQEAGDTETINSIKEQGRKKQEKMHLQGFGSAPVHDLLEPVKDKLPALAAACDVDVIVSKWEFDYLAPDAQVKDITDQMAALYNPGPKQLEWIRQMKDKAPISEEEILKHED